MLQRSIELSVRLFSFMFESSVELWSNVWSTYAQLFSIKFWSLDRQPKFSLTGDYVRWFLDLWFSFITHIELCSALWYSSQCLASELERRDKKLTGSPGTIKFPALFIIHSSYYKCWFAAQIKHGERVDHFRIGQFRGSQWGFPLTVDG